MNNMSIHEDTIFTSVAFQHLPPMMVLSNVSLIPRPSCVTLTADVPQLEEPKRTKPKLRNIKVPIPTLDFVS